MITITETKELFTFDELEHDAKDKAINEVINDWMESESFVPEDALELYNKAGVVSEQMQTPWFWGSYIWEYCEEFVLRECNSAYYLSTGKFYKWMEE